MRAATCRNVGQLMFACSMACMASSVPAASPLATQIQQMDGRVILRGTLRRQPMTQMLSRYVAAELRLANQRDRAEWQLIKTKADWEKMRDRRIKALRKSLGEFPDVPADLKVRVVQTTQGDGFEVDNVLFESRPGLVVTANLYRPAKPTKTMPGIIVCHSHIRPKETGARQLMGATWARAGCVVLVPDHLGHGERRQHPFRTEADFDKPFRASSQDYYFRYDAAMQTYLIGDSLMGWLAWDLHRGVDVLLRQPGVDPKRILMISEPAGGGDVAAIAAALDDRIAGVMVNNFGGPEPENGYPLPPDAESWFSYTSSGSWESTRNLRLSARDGFLPWTIVASVAPRRLIYYHEFYWDREQDPVWKRFQKIYRFYDAADAVTGLAGHGFVVGSSPENTHWTPHSRELLYPTLERWFGIKSPEKEYGTLLPEEQLLCLTPEGRETQSVSLRRLFSRAGEERTRAAREAFAGLSLADRRARLLKQWSTLLGDVAVASKPLVRKREHDTIGNICVERIQLGTEPGIIVPVLFLAPENNRPTSVVVAVAQSGKQSFLRHRHQQIAELLGSGRAVCLLDVRGTGETSPGDDRGRRSADTTLSASELMLGQTLVGSRLRDVQQVIRYLRERDDVDAERIAIWGDSFAPTNKPDTNFAVPRGIENRPHQSEPLGGLLALLAALFDEKIEAVHVHGGLASFHSVLDSPFCYVPHDAIVPGALTAGDVSDIAAAIAPRRLRVSGLVDGLNRRLSADEVRSEYSAVIDSYREAKAEGQFSIVQTSDQLFSEAPPVARAPFDTRQAQTHQMQWARHLGIQVESTNSLGTKMVLIPPGEFLMGSSDARVEAALRVAVELKVDQRTQDRIRTQERPQHRMVIRKPFLLASTEVTIAEFRRFVKATSYRTQAEVLGAGNSAAPAKAAPKDRNGFTWLSPGFVQQENAAVSQVSWNDAVEFCNWLSQQEKLTPSYRRDAKDGWTLVPGADGYRLPSEAQWEFACRAGSTGQYHFGDDYRELDKHDWYGRIGKNSTRVVGTKLPNAFGLFNMHGNVGEWCQDFYDPNFYQTPNRSDPTGPAKQLSSKSRRVIRGGDWWTTAVRCRSTFRGYGDQVTRSDDLGFRLMRSVAHSR